MTSAQFLPQDFHGKLIHVAEECAEIILEISKILRFGPLNYNPKNKRRDRNIEALFRECDDLIQVIGRLRQHVKDNKDW